MTRFRSARVLLAIGVLATLPIGALVASSRTASSMASAANKFLASLTPEERQEAALPLDGGDATHWHFIPNEMFPRKGLQMKAMTEAQRTLAHDLLKTGLSQRGYATATAIMALEDVLREMESAAGDPNAGGRRFARNPLEYYVTVFGTPSAKGAWGWRVEGHHVSLHFMVNDGTLVASSPTFFGSNPAEVREGPKKDTRILGAQEDAAYALLTALTDEQKKTAILQNVAPKDIVTMNKVAVDPLSPAGLVAADMTAAQRDLLMKLIDVYAGYMTPDLAAERTAKLQKAGIDKIAFAWAGPVDKGQKHYYRIQGPTFLVELDNSQNDGNHIHSVWRDFNGDFGRDVLREHIAAFHH
jgi:Protein of unknown function (DUF3500)